MTKYKVSAYLTDREVKLLDSLAMQWECSKSQAIIKAIKSLTNSDDNPIPTPKPIPIPSVTVGLSKEDVELLIDERIELLVNSRIEKMEKK